MYGMWEKERRYRSCRWVCCVPAASTLCIEFSDINEARGKKDDRNDDWWNGYFFSAPKCTGRPLHNSSDCTCTYTRVTVQYNNYITPLQSSPLLLPGPILRISSVKARREREACEPWRRMASVDYVHIAFCIACLRQVYGYSRVSSPFFFSFSIWKG